MNLIYLSIPYTDKDKFIMEYRYASACEITSSLLMENKIVFSPIVNLLHLSNRYNIGTTYDRWREYCEKFISVSDEIWVINLVGWRESKGVYEEVKYAKSLSKKVYLVDHIKLNKIEGL